MLLDLNRVEPGHFRDRSYDVCIAGGGVAGITLALALERHCSVALLEGGGLAFSADSQSVYQGRNVGREYFDLAGTRMRFLGGSSNHWEGWTRPLEAIDFERRSDVEHSGWPISRADLDPYLEPAKAILAITEEKVAGAHPARRPLPKPLPGFEQIYFWSSPLRFGERYRAALESSRRIDCYLNANVTNFRASGTRIAESTAVDYAGRPFSIRARHFVLAMGGIENARMLLNCTDRHPAGLGNGHDLVGRFFTEHPHFTVGRFILEDGVMLPGMTIVQPEPALLRQEQIGNFGLRCKPRSSRPKTGFKERLRQALCSADWLRSSAEYVRGEKVACDDGRLVIASEQVLNPQSRVSLGSERDRFGLRRPVLDWRLSEFDKRTMRQAVLRFGEAFAASGLGRVQIADWLRADNLEFPGLETDEVAGHHHMCTTRMAASPREGVVDSRQKVFGLANLYVAGSSTFATGGHANPTFTIVQMTLRLAEHLRDLHRRAISP